MGSIRRTPASKPGLNSSARAHRRLLPLPTLDGMKGPVHDDHLNGNKAPCLLESGSYITWSTSVLAGIQSPKPRIRPEHKSARDQTTDLRHLDRITHVRFATDC